MASLRPMKTADLFRFEDCNMDPLTETYNFGFYLEYLAKWPHLCHVVVGERGNIEGYILGKTEASPHYQRPTSLPYDPDTNKNPSFLPWHAHITALTVAPHARRQGHARRLTQVLEQSGDDAQAWFADLFVRTDNVVARDMYEGMGYSIYRRVLRYYTDGTDAYDMRKPLSRDKERKHVRENGAKFEVEPETVW